jgi:hypothetical protein
MAKLSLHHLQALVAKLGQKEQKPVGPKAFDVLVAPTLVDKVALKIFEALAGSKPKLVKNVITAEGFTITVKDRSRFVKFTAQNKGGMAEDRFHHHIKDLLKLMPVLDILFTDGTRKFMVRGVTKIKETGKKGTKKDGVGTGKKADFILTTAKGDVPISLKGENGDQLASADSIWRDKAKKVIEWALKGGLTQLIDIGVGGYKIDPPIAVEATDAEIKEAAFGVDILPNGCIVKGKMQPHEFALNANKGLVTVNCMKLYRSVEDFEGVGENVWVQMRNDAGRGSEKSGFWRGIRIVIVKERNLRGALLKVSKAKRKQIGV